MSHTPTPWTLTLGPDWYEVHGDSGDEKVFWASMRQGCDAPISDDAAHIVRCVNSHDDLERRLAQATALLREARAYILDSSNNGHRAYCRAICGPEHENWIEHNLCDCEVTPQLARIDAYLAAEGKS